MILTGEREGQAKGDAGGDARGRCARCRRAVRRVSLRGGTAGVRSGIISLMADRAPFVYMDNAATSWPKAPGVAEAVARSLAEPLGSPAGGRTRGRFPPTGWSSRRVARPPSCSVSRTRPGLIFTPGTTASLNLVLRGTLRPGALVALSAMEHNAVMRPLRALHKELGLRTRIFKDNGSFPGGAQGETGSPRLHFRQQRDGRELPICADGAGRPAHVSRHAGRNRCGAKRRGSPR